MQERKKKEPDNSESVLTNFQPADTLEEHPEFCGFKTGRAGALVKPTKASVQLVERLFKEDDSYIFQLAKETDIHADAISHAEKPKKVADVPQAPTSVSPIHEPPISSLFQCEAKVCTLLGVV